MDPRRPGKLGWTARQSLYREAQAAGQAGSLPEGETTCVLLNKTNPPQGDRPRALSNSITWWSSVPFTEENGLKL